MAPDARPEPPAGTHAPAGSSREPDRLTGAVSGSALPRTPRPRRTCCSRGDAEAHAGGGEGELVGPTATRPLAHLLLLSVSTSRTKTTVVGFLKPSLGSDE